MVVFKNWCLTCILPFLQNPIQRQGVLVKVGLKRLFWCHYFQTIDWSKLTFPSEVCEQVDGVRKKSQRVEGHFLLKGEHHLKNKATGQRRRCLQLDIVEDLTKQRQNFQRRW